MKRGHIPRRTCKACGRKAQKSELVRLIIRKGEAEEDTARKGPGRGIYCCADTVCRKRLLKNWKKMKALSGG